MFFRQGEMYDVWMLGLNKVMLSYETCFAWKQITEIAGVNLLYFLGTRQMALGR